MNRVVSSIGQAARVYDLGTLAIAFPVVLVAVVYVRERRALSGPEVERVSASAWVIYAMTSLGWTALWLGLSVWLMMQW